MKTQRKRRRKHITDYSKRIKMLKSEKPRIVFRKSNTQLMCQYVESVEAKDKIIFGLTSKELMKFGWPKENKSSLKSLPASYLLGFLAGKKILKENLKEPIVDLGMYRIISKGKIFGFVKGISDSGVKIKHEKKIFPEEKRIKGSHLKNKIPFEEIKSKIEKNG